MSQNYDTDVRKLDGDELLACPSCGTFMLPLRGYEISKSGSRLVGENEQDFLFSFWRLCSARLSISSSIGFLSRSVKRNWRS